MSVDPVGAGFGALSLIQGRLQAFLDSNEVRNTFKELKAELERSYEIPPTQHDEVWREVEGARMDPTFLGALFAYLERGEERATGDMRSRMEQLLRFENSDISRAAIAELVVRTIEKNRHHIKKSALEALHLDNLIIEQRVDEVRSGIEAARVEQRELGERLSAQLERTAQPVPGVRLIDRADGFAEIIERLSEHDQAEAGQLHAAIDAGGPERVAELIRVPQRWLEHGSAQLWIAAARVAQRGNYYAETETAFLRAADHPATEDRVRQLVRASAIARIRQDEERADELLASAREISAIHPAVLLADARSHDDAESIIQTLDGVEGQDPTQTAEIQATLCGAYLTHGDETKALAALNAAREADPDGISTREMSAIFALETARSRLFDDIEPNRRDLLEAGEQFASLMTEMLEGERPREAGAIGGRAVDAFVYADERQRADATLAALLEHPETFADPEVGRRLAEAALHAQRPELVAQFLKDDTDEVSRLISAEADIKLAGSDGTAGAAELTVLMQEAGDDAIRLRAALELLGAATIHVAVPWDDDAEALVRDHRPWVAARMKAEVLEDAGDREGAERLLRPFQSQRSVMRYLVGLAARSEDWEKALRLSERLLDQGPDERDRLRHCDLLRATGARDRARAEFLALARDTTLSEGSRRAAYVEAAQFLERDGDLTGLERLAREWFDQFPLDHEAGWLHLYALMRLTRFDQAFEAWRATQLDPATEHQAVMLAQLVGVRDDAIAALTRIADLTEQFPESEKLHLLLITTALRRGERDDVPQALGDRIREAFASFHARFPNSTSLQTIEIDLDDPAKTLVDLLKRSQGVSEKQLRELEKQIATGDMAIPPLAAVAGKSTGETWLLYGPLPLAYGDTATDEADREAAAVALEKSAALWDEAALFIAGGLGSQTADLLVNALPASLIVQSVLDAAADVLTDPKRDSHERIHYDEGAGQVVRTALSPKQIEREAARAEGTLELVRRLRSTADRDPNGDDELHQLLGDTPTPLHNWAAGMIAARRHDLPVYSDDRYIRNAARGIGLQAFGTLALIDVLADRGELEQTQRQAIRTRLHVSAAWGMRLSSDEFKRIGAASNWQVTRGMTAALNDIATWRRDARVLLNATFPFLQEVFEQAPHEFQMWVNRLLDAIVRASPDKDDGARAKALTLFALDLIAEPPILTDRCLQAFIEALRNVPWYLRLQRGDEDIVLGALTWLLEVTQPHSQQGAIALFKRAVGRLTEADREKAIAAFVR